MRKRIVVIQWISTNWLALLGIAIGLIAIFLHFKDSSQLEIINIHVSHGGTRVGEGKKMVHHIFSVSANIENMGSRPAYDCQGAITFFKTKGLPMYPQTKDHYANLSERSFAVYPDSKVHLIAAWNYGKHGSIDATKEGINYIDFIDNYLPLNVIVSCGNKRIKRTLMKEEFQKIYEEQQANSNLYEVR